MVGLMGMFRSILTIKFHSDARLRDDKANNGDLLVLSGSKPNIKACFLGTFEETRRGTGKPMDMS